MKLRAFNSSEHAAEFIGVSRRQFLRLCEDLDIEPTPFVGRYGMHHFYKAEDVLKVKAQRATERNRRRRDHRGAFVKF